MAKAPAGVRFLAKGPVFSVAGDGGATLQANRRSGNFCVLPAAGNDVRQDLPLDARGPSSTSGAVARTHWSVQGVPHEIKRSISNYLSNYHLM